MQSTVKIIHIKHSYNLFDQHPAQLKIHDQNSCFITQIIKEQILSYDRYGAASFFFAKPLMKVPYEGRTRWRKRAAKKPSGPASIAYGPPIVELKQFCCSIISNFSFKMSDVSKHYNKEFYYPDDLSDMELLQRTTHFESKEKSQNSSQM